MRPVADHPPSLVPADLPRDTTFKDARTRGEEYGTQLAIEAWLRDADTVLGPGHRVHPLTPFGER